MISSPWGKNEGFGSIKIGLGVLGIGYVLGILPNVFFSAMPKKLLFGKAFAFMPLVLGVGFLMGAFTMLAIGFLLAYMVSKPQRREPGVGFDVWKGKGRREDGVDVTQQSLTMPHAISHRGRFQGIVFTVPMSKWKRSDAVLDWPPVMRPFRIWYADIDQGTLVLTPLELSRQKDKNKRGKTSHSFVQMDEDKFGIPLEGCCVDIVRDSLQGRSDFLRRAPLLIRHESWLLMDGEHGFYLFANDPAAKMQWISAIRYWTNPADGNAYQDVQEMYLDYCAMMKASGPLTPYVAESTIEEDVMMSSLPSESAQGRRRRWRPWRNSNKSGVNSRREMTVENPQSGNMSSLDSFIEDRWMHSKVLGRSRRNAARGGAISEGHDAPSGSNSAHSAQPSPFSSPVKKRKEMNGDKSSEAEDGQESAETSGRKHWPASLPPLYSPDFFVNDVLLRACFDLVRNTWFSDMIQTRVQNQLNRMHTPDYVQSLNVIQVDPGHSAPSVANFSSLPSPSSSIMPQLIFDMKYQGSFSITIECKVDIRDARGWGTLDKAFDAIEGKKEQKPENMEESYWNNNGPEEIDLLRNVSGIHQNAPSSIEEEDDASTTPKTSRSPLTSFDSFRQGAAQRLRQFADSTAAHISKIPLRVKLTFSHIEGPMCIWMPPPPGDRLFWSFLSPPKLQIDAKPQIGDRVFKYAYHASRASAWIEARMKLAFSKNLVFPSGGDFPIPGLLGVDHVDACTDSESESSPSQSSAEMPSLGQEKPPVFEFRLRRR
ncbi:hypothetical protein M9434_001572 [Picochlorum sp. BPE23]|nr:hypothetical protein M9434_001572 [Picochlorum sp. BPE23]